MRTNNIHLPFASSPVLVFLSVILYLMLYHWTSAVFLLIIMRIERHTDRHEFASRDD